MIIRDELTTFLDKYLDIQDIPDDSWNGLQIEGKEKISNIITGVTAGSELFQKAIQEKADYIIVHHGHFWTKTNPSLVGWKKNTLKLLLDNNISLYGVHLPLDAHKEVGNNAQLMQCIGADITKEFHKHDDISIGWQGNLSTKKNIKEIEKILNTKLSTSCKTLPFGPKEISTVAVCSGGGGYPAFYEALDANIDLYITGDTAEIYHTAKDAQMHVIFAGHHATETLGVQALGKKLKEKFDIEHTFINIPTGL